MSTIIKVKCTDQVLAFENTPVIASGGLGEDFVSFEFCGKWDGLAKTAVFWRHEGDAYHAVLDRGGLCAIPHEVLNQEGVIRFGVFGVGGDGKQRTSDVLSYTIVKGVITEDTKPSEPTQDIYRQLLAQYAEVLVAAERAADEAAVSASAAEVSRKAAEAAAASAGAIEELASSAKETANSANTTANSAKQVATSANTTANSAKETANSANTTANSAKETANSHAARHGVNGDDPLTPEQIGALARSGGTLTGDVLVEKSAPKFGVKNPISGRESYITGTSAGEVYVRNQLDDKNRSALMLNPETSGEATLLRLVTSVAGSITTRNVLHTGNASALGFGGVVEGAYIGTDNKELSLVVPTGTKMLVIMGESLSTTSANATVILPCVLYPGQAVVAATSVTDEYPTNGGLHEAEYYIMSVSFTGTSCVITGALHNNALNFELHNYKWFAFT